jgi:ATP-binding cassette subfamily B protein/ATP-binding cassette subfamily C protein
MGCNRILNINFLGSIIKKFSHLLIGKYKVFLVTIIFFTILLSLIETIGISVIMPFVSTASNPDLLDSGRYKQIFDFLGFTSKESFIYAFGFGIVLFYLFRAVYNIIYTYVLNRFALGMFCYFSGTLFKTYLSIPYKVYLQKNSAELINIISSEANNTSSLLQSLLHMASELFTVLLIYGFILSINWQMTLVLTILLVIITLLVVQLMVRKTEALGIKRAETQEKLSHILGETFGNFKFIKLKGNQNGIFHNFENSTKTVSRATVISTTLGTIPKNILESTGFSLLVLSVIFILWFYHSAESVIPIIAMYALALYRILPSMYRILQDFNNIVFQKRSLDIVYENINQETEHEGDIQVEFTRSIRVENICFKYQTGNNVLNNVSLEIYKGEKVAVTGESGSGKSTLVDLIIGINKPSSGTIYIDDIPVTNQNIRSWRSKIGYIPQSIYLFDGTVAENITFGTDFDENRIIQVLQMANIWGFLSQKDGIHTCVGEGGIQLSGGQKQRIGIARALYNDPEVMVLDEATSALDNETESKIMDEIYNISKDKTLIVIAHRLSTIERCERRIQINKGRILE